MVSFNTNLPAIYASEELSRITDAINRSIQHLSTGKRIVTASDEPGSVGYLERARSYKIGWNRAKLNVEEAKDLLYTADTAISGINGMMDILQRIRELAVEASNNSTLTTEDLNAIQNEINSLIEEIDRIGNVTEYNTKKLLDGSFSGRISSSSPYITGYALGKVETATYNFTNAAAATRAIVYTNYPLPDTQKMPLSFDDSYDATKSLGEAVFSADTTSSASYNADYDIIFTPGNPDYDYIVYRTSTGESVGTGQFGVTFEDPDNPGAKITIYSGSQTIQEGYKGIWHADTNAANNVAQEGNRVVTGTVTLGDLSDRAMLYGNLYIEFDYVNNKLSYRVTDDQGNPLGTWVSVGATFYAYESSKLKGSYFTLSVNNTRSGYTGIAGKGDKWVFTFKEYNNLTSSGSVLIEIGEESYSIAWQSTDTVEDIKNRIEEEIGDKANVSFESSGERERIKITAKEPGSESTPSFRDTEGNLAYIMGFSLVSGTGTDAFITINGNTFGPQSSNIFLNAIPNVMLILKEGLSDENGTIFVEDKSQNVKASPKQGGNINFYIPTVNSTTLGLKDDEGQIVLDVTTPRKAEAAINAVDNAINRLSQIASTIGAFEERLTKAYNIAENQEFAATQSLSTIEDADIASEMVQLTTLEIKRDIATAMLSHANLQPQRVFELLFGVHNNLTY